jgi:Protein of unknown function (DUF2442)
MPGIVISEPEVTHISKHGVWLLWDNREVLLAFENFPWFRNATVGQISNVEAPSATHLFWPELDIDLSWEAIGHPDRFPLVSLR